MKNFSIVVLMIISFSFFELCIASRTYKAHRSKEATTKACIQYVFGEKFRLYNTAQKNCKGEPVGKHKVFPDMGKGSLKDAGQLKGLSVHQALLELDAE